MPISVIILLITLTAVALRNVTRVAIPFWVIMTMGALLVLAFRQITLVQAASAIEPDIIIYLFGIFLICEAAESSGYLAQLTDRLFYKAKTGKQALFVIIFILGLSSVFFMNDTIAIIGTPIILQLCKSKKQLIKPLLLALAYAVTIGSVMSPIGNPQNLLIAVKSGINFPFFNFIRYLGIPTIINLVIAYFYICLIFRKILKKPIKKLIPEPISDHHTVFLVKLSFILILSLLILKIVVGLINPSLNIKFSYIAIISAIPILLSKQRWTYLKTLDWGTLLFFASTFILMQSVWNSGFFQANIQHFHLKVTEIPVILAISVILSQFISNVPLVALYLPLLMHGQPIVSLLALAAGSTIAGNLSILGAVSNVIIIQNTERRGNIGFRFFEFIKYGIFLTAINLVIYLYFL